LVASRRVSNVPIITPDHSLPTWSSSQECRTVPLPHMKTCPASVSTALWAPKQVACTTFLLLSPSIIVGRRLYASSP
jgi:hypothetical protein